ncbi:MAG: AAA family ATPase [Dehalococcoidia bacterium]|nr:MAG: AAA family ATPase [Dehalococcoidia bacterium]
MVDKNEFFREATLRLCGHLEIEKGLQACIQYLKAFMPADELYLERYDRELGMMHVVARGTPDKAEKLDVLVPLPEEARAAVEALRAQYRNGTVPTVLVMNKPSEEPVTRSLEERLGMPLSSALSLPLIVEGRSIGTLALTAEGNDRFEPEHVELFALLKKPFYVAMSNTLKHAEVLRLMDVLEDENRYLQRELMAISGSDIIGYDFGLKSVMSMVQKVAPTDSPVMLLGETGTGKDVIANAIHYTSSRRDGPFVKVNCGAIPDTLLDSELFGHEKGAFTGALAQKRGRFERADKGTIFLDEIGELPPPAQVRMLRVLQDKEIERVGGTKTIPVDIRIIAATNRPMDEMLRDGRFREDLWFRLSVFPVLVPPLRERTEDIPVLVTYFIERKSKQMKLPGMPKLAPGAIERLRSYRWPGNVRELENVIERELILNRDGPLLFEHRVLGGSAFPSSPAGSVAVSSKKLDDVMAAHITSVLGQTEGKVNGPGGAAEILGLNASTLRARMKKLGIPYGRSAQDSD